MKLNQNNDSYNKEVEILKEQIEFFREQARDYKIEAEQYRAKATKYEQLYNEINSAFYWRILAPVRYITNKIKITLKYGKLSRKLVTAISVLKREGIKGVIRAKKESDRKNKIKAYVFSSKITDEVRKKEESTTFSKDIKFSILVPLYNTPKNYLADMIDSVLNQTYKNFELCLCDGSTDDYSYVGEYCKKLAQMDNRIIYKKLEKNAGISENTNECIRIATGDYIALFDHDDILHPSVLFENMRAICEQDADYIYTDEVTFLGDDITDIVSPHFKPDFAFYNLVANNYICHFSVFSRKLVDKVGMFRKEYDGSQDHDFILRLTDAAEKIVHIPRVLYFWRSHKNSVAMDINSKTYAIKAGQTAVKNFLKSKGINAEVSSSPAFPTIYKTDIEIKDNPLVSIIIPTKDHVDDLKRCINSIRLQSTYNNYEIIVVNNQSKEKQTKEYLSYISKYEGFKVLDYNKKFNYSAINNFAAAEANGTHLLFLNNDTEVITPDWIEQMLMYSQLEDVGAVGAKLYYEDNTIQHAGIILGMGADRIAGHCHYKLDRNDLGYMGRLFYAQNLSAVTAACMMVPKEVFDKVGGFSENLPVAYNDIDLCLKIRQEKYNIIFNAFCELYHYESKSRGQDTDADKQARFRADVKRFSKKWQDVINAGDPYFNPNFTLDTPYFDLKNEI